MKAQDLRDKATKALAAIPLHEDDAVLIVHVPNDDRPSYVSASNTSTEDVAKAVNHLVSILTERDPHLTALFLLELSAGISTEQQEHAE